MYLLRIEPHVSATSQDPCYLTHASSEKLIKARQTRCARIKDFSPEIKQQVA